MTHPLRQRNFLLLFLSQCLSVGGSKLFQIALVWWSLNSLSSQGWLALWNTPLLLLATVLPPIVFLPYIGNTVENKNPYTLVLFCELGGLLGCVLTLLLSKILSNQPLEFFLLLLFSTFWFACMHSILGPSLQKWIPSVVTLESLPKAIRFSGSTATIAGLVGAVLGGFIIDMFGLSGAIILNLLSYLISLVLLMFIKKDEAEVKKENTLLSDLQEDRKKESYKPNNNIWERYSNITILNPYPITKKLLLIFAGVNFFLTPILVFLPIYAKVILNGSGKMLGMFEAAISLGILSGSLFIYQWKFFQNQLRRVSALLLIAGVFFIGIGLFTSIQGVALCLFVIGSSLGSLNIQILTYFQHQIPDALKARFFALLQAFVAVAVPFGYLLVGTLSAWIQFLPFLLGSGVVIMGFVCYQVYLQSVQKLNS